MAQKGTDASQGQAGGCSKLHPEKPNVFRNVDDANIIMEAEKDLHLKYAKIALEFYEKHKDAGFEIVEPLCSTRKQVVVPGSKCNEEWWCHVTFTAKPKNVDCSDVSPDHFFGELLRDSTTGKYNATYCEIFKPSYRRITHGCLICPPLDKHPFDGFYAGRPSRSVAVKRLLKYQSEGSESPEVKHKRVEKNDVSGVQSGVDPSNKQIIPPWMISVDGQNQVKESSLSWCKRFNPTQACDRKYAFSALKSYSERKDTEYEILDVLFAYCKSVSLPKYEGVREWCHVSFIAKPKNKAGRSKHFFGEMVLDPISGTRKVIRCCTFKPRGAGLTYGCGFCPESPRYLHPADGYVAGLPSSTYPNPLGDDYLAALQSLRFYQ